MIGPKPSGCRRANGRIVKIHDRRPGGRDTSIPTVTAPPDSVVWDQRSPNAESRLRPPSRPVALAMALLHFSPEDGNWTFSIPERCQVALAKRGGSRPGRAAAESELQQQAASSSARTRSWAKRLPMVGTPYSLNYRSDRVPGLVAAKTIRRQWRLRSRRASRRSVCTWRWPVEASTRRSRRARTSRRHSSGTGSTSMGGKMLGGQTFNVKIDYNYPSIYQEPGRMPSAVQQRRRHCLERQSVAPANRHLAVVHDDHRRGTDRCANDRARWMDAQRPPSLRSRMHRVAHLGNGSRRRAGSLAQDADHDRPVPGKSVLFDVEVGRRTARDTSRCPTATRSFASRRMERKAS